MRRRIRGIPRILRAAARPVACRAPAAPDGSTASPCNKGAPPPSNTGIEEAPAPRAPRVCARGHAALSIARKHYKTVSVAPPQQFFREPPLFFLLLRFPQPEWIDLWTGCIPFRDRIVMKRLCGFCLIFGRGAIKLRFQCHSGREALESVSISDAVGLPKGTSARMWTNSRRGSLHAVAESGIPRLSRLFGVARAWRISLPPAVFCRPRRGEASRAAADRSWLSWPAASSRHRAWKARRARRRLALSFSAAHPSDRSHCSYRARVPLWAPASVFLSPRSRRATRPDSGRGISMLPTCLRSDR